VSFPRLRYEASPAMSRRLVAAQPWLVAGTTLLFLVAAGWNFAKVNGPSYYYKIGWKRFEKQDFRGAIPYFERAIFLGGDTPQAAEAAFFRSASLFRMQQYGPALAGYRDVVEHYPDSIWVAESHYHIGLCLRYLSRPRAAKRAFRFVTVSYPGNRWAGFAAQQLQQIREQAHGVYQGGRG
jgi:TolA-binding protein